MGCRHSTPTEITENEAVEEMADGFCDPAPPAPTDSRLPLSALQVFKLKKSWKGIKRSLEPTGIEMFVRMFKANQGLQSLFSSFKDLKTSDELRVNEALEKHAGIVMGVLDECISNIDNVDYILDILTKTGASHKNFSGFTAEFFWEIETPFLESVKLTLGDRYTDNMDSIYKITIKLILENLVKGIKES
ncbi:hypothetical protein SNE40_010037 [Patella caerulea]|uniref:Globin n=1 Tax=Patella caerulea TaxID=87958 RepID=A0AAN8JQT7_PATCE